MINSYLRKVIKARYLFLFLFLSCEQDNTEFPAISITKFPYNKPSALSITFDDGCPSVFTKIVPLLEENDLRASFFIIAGMAEQSNEWAKWNALIEKGHEVGNHSLTHSYYLGVILDETILNNEIDSSFRLLSSRLIKPPFSFGHPFHSTSPKADNIVFKHHQVSKISPPGFCHMIALYNAQLFEDELKEGLKNNTWIVTTAHGIDDCFAPITYTFLQEFVNTINAYRDEIYCDTFENLAKYKIESQNTRINIAGDVEEYTVTLANDLPGQFDFPLTLALSGFVPENYELFPVTGGVLDISINENILYVTLEPKSSFRLRRK